MSYRHTLEAALESLHDIEDMVRGFPGNGNIPAVEMDLALQKLRNLYELMLMMKKTEEVSVTVAVDTALASAPAPTPAPAPIMKSRKEKENQTLADQYKGRTTLHESLHNTFAREENTLSHAKPVKDLLAAIGINDRFTFIRELFNNDTAAFESSAKILNEAASFNDAYNFMIQHFDWDMDSEAVQLLLDIVRRKFIKGGHE
jgi:hypothetical protein